MKVELVAKTEPISGGSDMSVVEQAACICYNSEPTDDFRVAKACYRSFHHSILEHISFTFKVTGVSRALLAQLSRHRHISLSVASQRYIPMGDFYIPELGIDKNKVSCKNDLTEKQKNAIRDLYSNGFSTNEIGSFYGITGRIVQGVVQERMDLRTLKESKLINEEYFDKIDEPVKSYILGMIYTDGNISERKDGKLQMSISQHYEQRMLLSNIIKRIKKRGKVNKGGHGDSTIVVQVESDKICRKLIEYGITPRKAFTISPEIIKQSIPEKYIRDFIRGVLEGDGHVKIEPKCKNRYKKNCVVFTGTCETLEFVRQELANNIGTNSNQSILNNGDGKTKRLSYGSESDVKNILDWLYSDIDIHFIHTRKLKQIVKASDKLNEQVKNGIKKIAYEDFNCIIPNKILNNIESAIEFINFCFDTRESYNKLVYNQARNGIVGEKAYENARAVLPNACCTELFLTMNARALIEASNKRLCSRAQDEIREMFQKMKQQVSIHSPIIASWMVPSCEKNKKYPFCPEHKSCGRHPKLEFVYQR